MQPDFLSVYGKEGELRLKSLLCLLVKGYQRLLSPLKPPCCRFTPTCSAYMIEAIGRFGALKGIILGSYRILRCNPFCTGGYDPVPFCFTFSGKQLPRVALKLRTKNQQT